MIPFASRARNTADGMFPAMPMVIDMSWLSWMKTNVPPPKIESRMAFDDSSVPSQWFAPIFARSTSLYVSSSRRVRPVSGSNGPFQLP
ncbi:hypothetical protein D3C87_1905760 [compost metagenome]